MSENNIYYYEIFLRSTIKNKEYKISLGSLSGSKFKTLDTEFPTSRFLSSVIGGTTSIINNIDYILEYNKSIYNLSNIDLKNMKKNLISGNYYFDVKQINFSQDAIGDTTNNNNPYIIVNDSEVEVTNIINTNLNNLNNNNYFSNFSFTILYSNNNTSTIEVTIYSSSNPLPTPISAATTPIQDLRSYLVNFFEVSRVNNLLENAINIINIEWLGNFWKQSTNVTSLSTNEFRIVSFFDEKGEVIGHNTTFKFPSVIRLDGTPDKILNDEENQTEYDVRNDTRNLSEKVRKDLVKYLKKYTNPAGDINKPNSLIQCLFPTKGSAKIEDKKWPEVLSPTPTPKDTDIFAPINWGEVGSLPSIRFAFNGGSEIAATELPEIVTIQVQFKYRIFTKFKKQIYQVWPNMKATCIGLDENFDVIIEKFNGKAEGPDFGSAESIVKESGDPFEPSRGTVFDDDVSLAIPVETPLFDLDLKRRDSTLKRNRSNRNQWFITYTAEANTFYETAWPKFQKAYQNAPIDAYINIMLADYDPTEKSPKGQSLKQRDIPFFRNIISQFRDKLLEKANNAVDNENKKCYLLHHENGELSYDFILIEESTRILGARGQDLFNDNQFFDPGDRRIPTPPTSWPTRDP